MDNFRTWIVGLILAGTNRKPEELAGHESLGPAFVSYVTSLSAIKERIKSKTGRSLVLDTVNLDELDSNDTEIVLGY